MMQKPIHPADDNYQGLAKQLRKLTDSLVRQTQAIHDANENISDNESVLENKLFRFTLSNNSFIKILLEKTELIANDSDKPIKSIDLNGLVSLVRQQIEAYAKLFHLCFDDINKTEKEWRILIYQLQGLRKQEGFKSSTKQPRNSEIESMMEKNDNELKLVINRIESHSNFQALDTQKQKNSILKGGKAIYKDISDILVDSGLSERHFLLWSVYSNYAHNEYLSDRQYEAILQESSRLLPILELLCKVLIMLTVRLCFFMSNRFASSKVIFEAEDELTRLFIEAWSVFISHMNSMDNESS